MSRVLLIRPNYSFANAQPNPPIGLGYLAATLEKHGHKVFIADLSILKIQNDEVVKLTSKFNPDVIGITALTAYYSGMKDICRKLSREVPIVIGGIHVSSLTNYSFNECNPSIPMICHLWIGWKKVAPKMEMDPYYTSTHIDLIS